jgi:hypothetical protein
MRLKGVFEEVVGGVVAEVAGVAGVGDGVTGGLPSVVASSGAYRGTGGEAVLGAVMVFVEDAAKARTLG